MEPSLLADNISPENIKFNVGKYHFHVKQSLQELDQWRRKVIPGIVQERLKDGDAYLEKPEVEKLVEWKLRHGTYRPKLASLVTSNSAEDIEEATRSAFEQYIKDEDAAAAVKALTKLKGIGPATASLLLSCYDPVRVPFFSDELFRYVNFEDKKAKGWDRKIGYTMKEYKSLVERVDVVRKRAHLEYGADISAISIEELAYVLG
ncbi:hypothetical protein M501DRAFT_930211, partial [Patellaria atrata CBS 101060]